VFGDLAQRPPCGAWQTPETVLRLEKGLRVVSQSIRVEDSVTSLSWIPREAIEGMTKIPFEVNATRYDQPPPDRLAEGSLETLQDAGRFRFVNRLWAWADIQDGKIVRYGYESQSLIGKTRVKLGRFLVAVPPVPFPVLRAEPVATETEVRFVQTAGGRTGVPADDRRHPVRAGGVGRQQAGYKLGDLAVSQAPQPEPGYPRPALQFGEPLPDAAVQLLLTKGADQHDRLVTQPDRQEGEQLAG